MKCHYIEMHEKRHSHTNNTLQRIASYHIGALPKMFNFVEMRMVKW